MSATRDGQTDQSLFYFDIFDFGQRIKAAHTLVAGSSHAEFGISAAKLGGGNSFNMALGGAESLNFAETLLKKYQPPLSLLVIDPFATDFAGPSTEARGVLASTRGEAYHRVLDIWAGFARDWILQGLLPRITVSKSAVSFEQPVGSTIIRDWQTADVIAVYSGKGEVYADATKGHPIDDGPKWKAVVAPLPSDVAALHGMATTIVVTTLPYPGMDQGIARELAVEIGAQFVPIAADRLLLWDYHHVNKVSREIATEKLMEAMKIAK